MKQNHKIRPCPDCGHQVSARASKCPSCGGPLWHKTVSEAWGWNGFGVLDLIPGIRDLPTGVKILLMVVLIVVGGWFLSGKGRGGA